MSVQAIGWALDVDAGKSGAKLVLLILANYADEDGECWPSQERIARQSGQSLDTVQRQLKRLEALGLIKRSRRQNRRGTRGGRRSDTYVLALKPQNAACRDSAKKPQRLRRKNKEVRPQIAPSYKEEPSRTVSNKTLPPESRNGRRRAGRRHSRSNEGTAEVEIAARLDGLGFDGWDVLFALPGDEVGHLCSRQRSGLLDDDTLVRLAERNFDDAGKAHSCSPPLAALPKVEASSKTGRVLSGQGPTRHAAPRKVSREAGFSKAEVHGEGLKFDEVRETTS